MPATDVLAYGLLGMVVAGGIAFWVIERLTKAGAEVDRLADPMRCLYCGGPYVANDDVFSPHECSTEVGF